MNTQNNPSPTDLKGPDMEAFIDEIVKEKNFTDAAPEVIEIIKKDLRERIDKFIMARIISAMSDEKVIQFEEMLKTGKTEEEIQNFVTTTVPDFVDFLTQVLMEFRGIYLGLIVPPIAMDENTGNLTKPPAAPVMPADMLHSTGLPPAPPAVPNIQKTIN